MEGGARLQLPAYLTAVDDAEEATALYWFITRSGEFQRIEHVSSPENKALFERTVGAIVQGIRAGAFPAVPSDDDEFHATFKNCRFCDFDRICSRRRDYEFLAKEGQPGVEPWRRVALTALGKEPSSG